jgi:hypothetical protein
LDIAFNASNLDVAILRAIVNKGSAEVDKQTTLVHESILNWDYAKPVSKRALRV